MRMHSRCTHPRSALSHARQGSGVPPHWAYRVPGAHTHGADTHHNCMLSLSFYNCRPGSCNCGLCAAGWRLGAGEDPAPPPSAPPCSPWALLPQHSAVVRAVIPTRERALSRNDQAGAALQQAACGSPPVSSKACACCTQRLIRRWHASHRAATKPHVRRCRSCRRAGDSCCASDSTVSMSLRTIWACAPGVQAQSEAGSRSLMGVIYVSLSTTWACASGCQAQ